jgi:3-phosphoshikimate 1-carboxyvinyltransferase
MLRAFGVDVASADGAVSLMGGGLLHPPASGQITIPGDFSSAAFPLVAALIVPGSEVRLTGVGLNPTRTGLYDLLTAAGADITVSVAASPGSDDGIGEPAGDLTIRGVRWHPAPRPLPATEAAGDQVARSARWHLAPLPLPATEAAGDQVARSARWHLAPLPLRATEAAGDLIVRAIDEFPIFAVAATQAQGTTEVREAAELRVKESDRIASVAGELRKMGAQVEERPDGMTIHGPTRLSGATVECRRDHRLAMALAVAGLVADGETVVRGAEAIDDSFPGFVETMQALGADIRWR